MSDKEYVDRGVQTDIPDQVSAGVQVGTPAGTSYRMISAVDIRGEPTTLSELILSPPRLRRRSTSLALQDQSAYSHVSPVIETDEHEDSMKLLTTIHDHKRQPLSKLPRDRTLKSATARIVSLPETTAAYSAKILEKVTMRVVSQPERTKPTMYSDVSSPFSDRLDLSDDTLDPLVSESHQWTRLQFCSNATDLPHTPSPPSSPESIVIIADKSQLPKGFLSNTPDVEDSLSVQADDDGWITWAKSPPRPIPALHGPLSLPYARCPSGAEGTIIEEQENLPRMIWGLEGEEERNTRVRSETLSRIASHATPRKTDRPTVPQVPPRFQKTEETSAQRTTAARGQRQANQYQPTADPQQPNTYKPMSHADIDLSLSGHGLIDLSNILRPRVQIVDPRSQQFDLKNDLRFSQTVDPKLYGFDNDPDVDWQSVLIAHDHLKNQPLPSSSSTMTELSDSLTPSISTSSMSSLQSLASSRSPIVLDSYSQLSHVSHPSLAQNTPRRMSALEIAQNYRQQQIQQQQPMLPTPPNSSSPIWASRFSPYQEFLVSPDLLVLSGLSAAPAKQIVSPNQQYSDPRQQNAIQLFPREASRAINLNGLRDQLDISSLAPAAYIQDPAFRIQDMTTNAYIQDPPVTDPKYLRARPYTAHPLTPSPMALVTHSPAPPRPPPNTPMTALPSPRIPRNHDGGRARVASVMAAPASPTSPPDARLRSVSYQQPRSIPLSQVLSRRLSSVPEEDVGAHTDFNRSSSPSYAASHRSRSFSSEETPKARRQDPSCNSRQTMLAPGNLAHSSLRTPSPAYDHYIQDRFSGNNVHAAYVDLHEGSARPSRRPNGPPTSRNHAESVGSVNTTIRGKEGADRQQAVNSEGSSRGSRGGRGNRARGGGRGKRGRGSSIVSRTVNGPERVDGGLTVRS